MLKKKTEIATYALDMMTSFRVYDIIGDVIYVNGEMENMNWKVMCTNIKGNLPFYYLFNIHQVCFKNVCEYKYS